MTRIEVIDYLIGKNGYKNYLEIGCQNDICFNAIKIDGIKTGVDPEKGGTLRMTSDEFFDQNKQTFDIIFIDGLHHAEQVYKDILNSLAILNEGGIIICHDMIPSSEEAQRVPRETKHWNGDCWKAFVKLRINRSDLTMHTIQTDCGLGVISIGSQEVLNVNENEINYKNFEADQKEWLNAITVEEFLKLY